MRHAALPHARPQLHGSEYVSQLLLLRGAPTQGSVYNIATCVGASGFQASRASLWLTICLAAHIRQHNIYLFVPSRAARARAS